MYIFIGIVLYIRFYILFKSKRSLTSNLTISCKKYSILQNCIRFSLSLILSSVFSNRFTHRTMMYAN
jgi:hypothetical protein